MRGTLSAFGLAEGPLTRIASAMRSDLSPQAGRGKSTHADLTQSHSGSDARSQLDKLNALIQTTNTYRGLAGCANEPP